MYKQVVRLGVASVKRSFLSMEEAVRQKNRFMAVIRAIVPQVVELVDADDIAPNGILFDTVHIEPAVRKFRGNEVDALFLAFCDFGEEEVAAGVASALGVPTLVWGARDERPNTDSARGRDTQCGMFAATKVLRRCGVQYSYLWNVPPESGEFHTGFDRFIRVAAILKAVKGLHIAKIGARPGPFMSVMADEADLLTRFGITTVPISPSETAGLAKKLIETRDSAFEDYFAGLAARFDCGSDFMRAQNAAALKMAIETLMQKAGCSVAASECWSVFPDLIGVSPCLAMGELACAGLPVACEADVHGAVTLAILRACLLYQEPEFLADLTIRHPENDNAELLWHCGPFPYNLKAANSIARIVDGMQRFELRQGELTLCRFDGINGTYHLFAGEGCTTTGPETTGTYVWLEVDNWKRWEEHLMFGPYIHHIGGAYGHYLPVLREAARLLGLQFDCAHEQGIYSL